MKALLLLVICDLIVELSRFLDVPCHLLSTLELQREEVSLPTRKEVVRWKHLLTKCPVKDLARIQASIALAVSKDVLLENAATI